MEGNVSQKKAARLYLRPTRRDASGKIIEAARYVIRDGGREFAIGCSASQSEDAERALAAYVAAKYAPVRKERHISEIGAAEVIMVYMDDVAPRQARPKKVGERAERLLQFFGTKMLSDVNGALCRAYAEWRGSPGGARRDLQDLAAAINHHAKEGFHREIVRVVLPPRGQSRKRWLTRSEAARLIWACWRCRELQGGVGTDKRPLRHLCRFLLMGVYTGSRPAAIFNAAWFEGPGLSYVDLERGVFHRHAAGAKVTAKRQPTVRLAPRLLAHLRRWRVVDEVRRPGSRYVVMFGGAKVASVKTALAHAGRLSGVTGVSAYTLRHTAGAWLAGRVDTRIAAEYIGTTEEIFRAHYGHLDPVFQEAAARPIGGK
jgi:integrase